MRPLLSLLTLLTLLTTLTLHAQVPSYVPANGLVGWWPFNGNANDESGNGNNGTVNGAMLTMDRFGNLTSSYHFDNAGNITVTSNQFQNYVNTGFTISYWFTMEDSVTTNTHCILTNYDGVNGVIISYNTADVLRHMIRTANANPPEINHFIPIDENYNRWRHAIYVWNPPVLTSYIDGILVNQVSNSGINNLSVCCNIVTKFGAQWNNTTPHKGKLDDVGIWNRPLTPSEIQDLYTAGVLSVPCISPTAVSFSGLSAGYTTSDGPATLTGTPAGGVFIGPGVTGSTFSPAVAGEGTHSISYTYLDGNNCVNTYSLCTSVALGMGVEPGGNALGGLRVFPNPNRGQFTVELDLSGLVGLQVFDARGALLHNEVFTASGSRTQRTLDLSTFAKGSYTLLVEHDGQRVRQTVVVE